MAPNLHNSYNGFTKIYFLFKCSVILLQIVAMRKNSLSQNLHQIRRGDLRWARAAVEVGRIGLG